MKRILSLLLVAAMLLSVVPATWAVEQADTEIQPNHSRSLLLSDSIAINFKVSKAWLDANDIDKVVFVKDGVEVQTYDNTIPAIDGEQAVFPFTELTPAEMDKTITIQYYSGETCVVEKGTTVLSYCLQKFKKSEESRMIKTALYDMLKYGVATAKDADQQISAELETALQTYAEYATTTAPNPVDKTAFEGEAGAVVWKGAGLNLKDSVTLRVKFQAESVENLVLVMTCSGKSWAVRKFYPIANEEGCYYAYFSALDPAQMRELIYGQFYDRSGNAVSNKLIYSVESYAAKVNANDNRTQEEKDLAKALITYGDSVRAWVMSIGCAMFEAEDTILAEQDQIVIKESATASGGKVAYLAKPTDDYANFDADLSAQINFNFKADQKGTYAIWARMYANSTATSMIASVNGQQYQYVGMVEIIPEKGDFRWSRIATVECEVGDVVDIRIRSRHSGGEIDKFIITSNITYIPTGEGEFTGPLSWDTPVEFDTEAFPAPELYPVEGQHPRVMFTEADIPGILENLNHEDHAAALAEFNKIKNRTFDGKLPTSNGRNYNAEHLKIIEAKAFDYAIYKNSDDPQVAAAARTHGNEAVTAMINFLKTVIYTGGGMDYRYIGATLFTAAEVYDWCYDLLNTSEMRSLVAGAQIQAAMIEAGFPPTTTLILANNGHDAEYQIQQCWLAFAIAVADEFPSIYEFVAGMYFDLFIDTRNAWFSSQAYHQGSAYGTYRFDADMWGQWLIYQMTGGNNDLNEDGKPDGHKVFTDDAASVIYQWMYTRRPDGKIMTEGDDYEMTQNADGSWFDNLKSIIFSIANFYDDPLLYRELLRVENPGLMPGGAGTIYSPVMILALNDPNTINKTAVYSKMSDLPLSKYLPTPYGGMVARTGWDWGLDSDDVLVTMQMTQRYLGGHQHADTGSFQIYYKGLLSGDSGYYVNMGVEHDVNYYGLSVAHNTLSITSKKNPTGVQNENLSVEDLLNDDPYSKYLRSKIVGQEFGPSKQTPDYTYIAGDIAGAYDDNVQEAIRSMLFLNLEQDGITGYPGAFVVFDQIKTGEVGSKKSFLLHSLSEPSIHGNTITILNNEDGYNGKLVDQILYVGTADTAVSPEIEVIGGEGKEFWYNGANHPNESTVADSMAYEPGWGRIEISTTSGVENQTDYMLNVMYVSDANGNTEVIPATLIKGENIMGAQIFNHVAMFNMDGNHSIDSAVTFTIPASAEYSTFKVNVAGMKAGKWTVTVDGESRLFVATEDGGMLYFDAPAGKVTVAPHEHIYDHDMDATCNLCDHIRHVHTFSTDWTSNNTYHWHVAICEHTEEISGKAEHTFGADNLCTACGHKMEKAETIYFEAENVTLLTKPDYTISIFKTVVSTVTDTSASNDRYVTLGYKSINGDGANGSDNLTKYPAHISFAFTPNTTGNYYIWARVKNTDTTVEASQLTYIDEILSRTGNANITEGSWRYDQFVTKAEGEFVWKRIAVCDWQEGNTYSVRIRARYQQIAIDQFMVTSDENLIPHTHTFESAWTSNDTHHWREATCGHTEVYGYAKHVYNADKVCTTCGIGQVFSVGKAHTSIEAEDAKLFTGKDTTCNPNVTNVVIVGTNSGALNNKVATLTAGKATDVTDKTEEDGYPAHISFKVKPSEAGTYYVWARVSIQYSQHLNIWTYIDGSISNGTYNDLSAKSGWQYDKWDDTNCTCATTNDFIWIRIATCEWTDVNTEYSVRLRSRQGGEIIFDRFVVTSDNTYAPHLGDSLASFATDTIIEAEDTSLDSTRVVVQTDATDANVKVVTIDKIVGTAKNYMTTAGAPGAINFQVQATTPGTYYIWAKVTNFSSLWYSLSDSEYTQRYKDQAFTTGWYKIASYTVNEAGEMIIVRLSARQLNNSIDQFYVTSDKTWNGTAN